MILMGSRFEKSIAREYFVEKEGWTTAAEVSNLSGNPTSDEEKSLDKLVEAGRIAKVELILPRYPDDGFGNGNRITYYMSTNLFRKIQEKEKKPESPEAKIRETYGYSNDTNPIRRYTGFDYARISATRWKLHTEGKEGFKLPGAIKC